MFSFFSKKEIKPATNIEEKTAAYFRDGYVCSEAILKSMIEEYEPEASPGMTSMASGFGRGIQSGDICGIVAGAVMAIGYLTGRKDNTQNNKTADKLSKEFRKAFLKEYGDTNCGVLLKGFGKQKEWDKCRDMTGRSAGILLELLYQHGIKPVTK